MKKVLLLFVIALCLSMIACGYLDTDSAKISETAQQPTQTTSPTTVPTEHTSNFGGDVVFLTIETLEEYEKHFEEQGGYPDSFITYHDLSNLGEFRNFICQSYILYGGSRYKEYTTYQYELLVDGTEFDVMFRPAKSISDDTKEMEQEDVKATVDKEDMRVNRTDAVRGKLVLGDMTYNYLDGKLHTIKWVTGETQVTIYFEEGRNEKWPENDPDTLIGRMLIWDTAEEALGELRQKIDGKIKDLKYPD